MRKNDLIAILVLNIILVALIGLGDVGASGVLGFLRFLVGASYLIFVPGYVLQAALLPKQTDLASIDRLALSFGLSIAVIPVLGLVLDGPLGGIFLWQSTIFLTLFTATCEVVIVFRRSRLTEKQSEPRIDVSGLGTLWSAQGTVSRILAIIISLGVLTGAAWLGLAVLSPSPDKQFTEFSLVDSAGSAADYPLEVRVGRPFSLKVGVVNEEGLDVTYSIKAQLNGQPLAGTAPFTLNNGQSISLDLTLAASTAGDQQLLEILLLRDNQVYRRLYLWLNVKSP